jgi:hypothetical protein
MDYQILHPVQSPLGDLCELCNNLLEGLLHSFSADYPDLGMFETVIQMRKVEDLRPTLCRLCAFIQQNINAHTQEAELSIQETVLSFEIRPSMLINGCFQLSFRAVQGKSRFRICFSSPHGLCTYYIPITFLIKN